MLLNIYLGTTAISWAVTFIFSNAYDKKIKREGYKFVKEKKTFPEKTASFISTTFILSIPVYNILNAVSILIMPDKYLDIPPTFLSIDISLSFKIIIISVFVYPT